MWPEVDADTLLFNLYIDRERFYDNSDGVITITHLKRKVLKVLQMSMEELEIFCGKTITYWQAHRPRIIFKSGIGYNYGMMRTVYKEIRYKEIDEQYDPMMSVRENIEAGIDVPRSTLYRYRKERGYDKIYNKKPTVPKIKVSPKRQKIEAFQELYNPQLTSRENREAMAAEGLVLTYRTYMRWKDLYAQDYSFIDLGKVEFHLPQANLFMDINMDVQKDVEPSEERTEFEKNNWPDFWHSPFENYMAKHFFGQ